MQILTEATMPLTLSVGDLTDYTEWERRDWHDWLQRRGDSVLNISAGPHGDGRFETVGELIRHIFSAEKRYVDRLSGKPLTDATSIRADSFEILFEFGQLSWKELKAFIESFPTAEWDVPQAFTLMNSSLRATPKKIIIHVLIHEIRHWAQIATVLRLNGLTGNFHDFLFSPVFGGEFKREPQTR
jgi:uncharacterized damage-inducible protein DinB